MNLYLVILYEIHIDIWSEIKYYFHNEWNTSKISEISNPNTPIYQMWLKIFPNSKAL